VKLGTRRGFATAGHCSWGSASDNWYMYTYPDGPSGFVGHVESGTQLLVDMGKDFMVVGMNTDEASTKVYDTSRIVGGASNPVLNETICMSPGQTDNDTNSGEDCGFVRVASLSWQYHSPDPCDDCIVRGADADGIATTFGDSGSPLLSKEHESDLPHRAGRSQHEYWWIRATG
jgi:hypothetical protein